MLYRYSLVFYIELKSIRLYKKLILVGYPIEIGYYENLIILKCKYVVWLWSLKRRNLVAKINSSARCNRKLE